MKTSTVILIVLVALALYFVIGRCGLGYSARVYVSRGPRADHSVEAYRDYRTAGTAVRDAGAAAAEPSSACGWLAEDVDNAGGDGSSIGKVCEQYNQKCGAGSTASEVVSLYENSDPQGGSSGGHGVAAMLTMLTDDLNSGRCAPPMKCAADMPCPSFLSCTNGACA